MCGIAGSVCINGPVSEDLLLDMRTSLTHRGPDDSGIWISPDRSVGLAHVRLSIIDLSAAGHQPMANCLGELQIVFNGEIYNYQSVRTRLISEGHQFRSYSDTEVILEAYRKWGPDCLSQLNGMFAFALYDHRARRLMLARDRVGEKPLYFVARPERFSFASELQALLADKEFRRSLDENALNSYLAYGYVLDSRSILRDVQQLAPGSAMLLNVETGEQKIWRYWDIKSAGMLPKGVSEDDLAEQCRELIKESTRMRLVADVPVGIMLSGGIDSSLIAAFASAVSSTRIKTFTVTFPGSSVDESKYARLVAEHIGTEHHELIAQPSSMHTLPYIAQRLGEPLADCSLIPVYELSKMIREHVTVALGGDGGDELFGGYPHYSWVLQLTKLRSSAPRFARSALGRTASLLPIGTRGRQHLMGLGGDVNDSVASINQLFDLKARRELLCDLDVCNMPESLKRTIAQNEDSTLRKASLVDLQTFLVDDILVKSDRASMLNSLEVRAPFLDHHLVEFAFGLPDHLRATGKEKKVLLRKIARPYMPKELDLMRKQGFFLPLASWFKAGWGDFVSDVLLDSQQNLFNKKMVKQLIQRQYRGFSNASRLYALTMFELWRRYHKVAA